MNNLHELLELKSENKTLKNVNKTLNSQNKALRYVLAQYEPVPEINLVDGVRNHLIDEAG